MGQATPSLMGNRAVSPIRNLFQTEPGRAGENPKVYLKEHPTEKATAGAWELPLAQPVAIPRVRAAAWVLRRVSDTISPINGWINRFKDILELLEYQNES